MWRSSVVHSQGLSSQLRVLGYLTKRHDLVSLEPVKGCAGRDDTSVRQRGRDSDMGYSTPAFRGWIVFKRKELVQRQTNTSNRSGRVPMAEGTSFRRALPP